MVEHFRAPCIACGIDGAHTGSECTEARPYCANGCNAKTCIQAMAAGKGPLCLDCFFPGPRQERLLGHASPPAGVSQDEAAPEAMDSTAPGSVEAISDRLEANPGDIDALEAWFRHTWVCHTELTRKRALFLIAEYRRLDAENERLSKDRSKYLPRVVAGETRSLQWRMMYEAARLDCEELTAAARELAKKAALAALELVGRASWPVNEDIEKGIRVWDGADWRGP